MNIHLHIILIYPLEVCKCILLLYSGEEETLHTKMKSILAQLEYTYQIRTWQSKGVPFDIYLYVPEIHPDTNATFYEQEDAVHLLKVMIGVSTSTMRS